MTMKTLALGVLAVVFATAVAAKPTPFRFDLQIKDPALPLLESVEANNSLPPNPLSLSSRVPGALPKVRPGPAAAARLVSAMPILEPAPGIDYRLRIARPDDSIEYKLLVKIPEIESSR